MKAIIQCGGKGTRISKISKNMPKPMVEINGKPLLYWIVLNLKKYGIKEIFITLHYKPEVIKNYFKNGKKFGVNIHYFYEKEMLGTGGSLTWLKSFFDDDVVVVYGDIYLDFNFNNLKKFHKKHKATITAVIQKSLHPEDSDLVVYDKSLKLKKIDKKPHKKIPRDPHSLAAVYLFNHKVTKYLNSKKPYDIAHDLLPIVLKDDFVFCYNTPELAMDIGTPDRLSEAKRILIK